MIEDLAIALFTFVVSNYIPVLIFYVLGGCMYAFGKWIWSLYKLKGRVAGITDDFLLKNYASYFTRASVNGPPAPKDGAMEKARQAARERETSKIFDSVEYPPKASSNKGRLASWAFFWPINLVYTMLHDVVRDIFNWIYNRCGALLDSVARGILPK